MRFGILGPLRVSDDTRPVVLGARNLRILVATLLCQPNRAVAVDTLLDAIWDSAPPRTAGKNLHVYVHQLRRTIGETRVVRHPHGYELVVHDGELDADVFRALVRQGGRAVARDDLRTGQDLLARGLALWRGPALDDLANLAVLRETVVHLTEQRLAAVEDRVDVQLALGSHHDAVAELSALVLEHPLRERLRGQLMLALYRSGRQAEALLRYQDGRRILADELGIEPSPELQRLQLTILRGDGAEPPTLRGDGPERPALRGDGPEPPAGADPHPGPPRQLPADVAAFTGRAAEVAEISRLLAGAATVCVAGMGGVGKTTLAVRVAHEAQDRYADGCLFVDLRGTDPDPPDSHQVMGSVLRCLGLPGSAIPEDRQARAGLYRTRLTASDLLLVLDNAADERQVRPLVPPGGRCGLLVTSRRLLAGLDDVHVVELTVLPAAAAVDLLAAFAGGDRIAAEPDAARDLVELCGRLPLAVRIVGGRLARRGAGPLSRMAARLADRRSRLDELTVGDRDVRAVLALSVGRLDQPSAVLLRRMGMLPVTECAPWTAAALLGVPLRVAERVLDGLAEVSLVSAAEDAHRFRLHDLVQLYAREQVDDDDVTALRRAYGTLLDLALSADAALPVRLYPTPASPEAPGPAGAGRPWFAAESTLLLAAARDAAERGWTDLAWRLVTAMTNCAMLDHGVDEWIPAAERMLAALDETGDGYGDLLLGLGIVRQNQGQFLPARRLLRRARRVFARRGDARRAATAAMQLSVSWRAQGEVRPAAAAVEWALARLTVGPRHAQLGWAYLTQGHLLLELGRDLPAARAAYRRALAVLEATGDRTGEGNALTALASSLVQHDPDGEAEALYRRGLAILAETGDMVGLCVARTGLARERLIAGDLDAARSEADQALSAARALRIQPVLQFALMLSGRIASRLAGSEHAGRWFADAAAVARSSSRPGSQASALFQLAGACWDLGDHEEARAAGREALDLYVAIDSPARHEVAAWLAERGVPVAPAPASSERSADSAPVGGEDNPQTWIRY
ncbi:BTAD domain-containing putative transcriptional regulator [Longispora sp. NPDC051575]|uniref:AfsR/SARP family transcriptional regulator n=1 Tax=Longispora sp. NPDC051575 TaxID=3154943 RepID=UPI00343C4BDD